MHIRRCAAVLTAAVLMALGPAVSGARAAPAGLLDVTCVGSQTSTYSPPLTLTAQASTTTASTQYGPCVSLSRPDITAGSRSASVSYPSRTCLDLLDSQTVAFTITWNTGQTSAVSGNATTTVVGATLTVTITGNVTSGLFAGSSIVQVNEGPATDITLCTLGLGSVSSAYSLVALEITSV
ncbi:hypothetical protein [Streptomyces nitrosporeus]|uniref:hypothetical protein n=1 Tax=Streptomyces nitrosporeus TaxID=28894 RepID=UPI00399F0FAA